MRPIGIKLRGIIGLGVIVFIFTGCSSSTDLLDETGQRYLASIAVKDNNEETLTVDVIQDFCDNEAEDYGRASAAVQFSVDASAPGITLHGYTLEYIPLPSEDGTGNIVTPPTLDGPIQGGNLGIDIPSGGNAEFDITCISVDTKEEYRTEVGWLFYSETAGGLAAMDAQRADIAAKEGEINDKNEDIDDKEDEIAAATALGLDTTFLELELSRLEDDLDDLESELAELETELAALPYTLWSVPELWDGRYRIRITFDFEDEYGEDITIVREATVWLGPVDNC